ncbi:hypothetical protein JCM11251_007612 [Rhodosporidiobolus azoricus]
MTSPSSSTSPPSPPSRPVPLPPDPSTPTSVPPLLSAAPPLSVEDQIDLSTLSYLSSLLSLRRPLSLYPLWLFRLVVFTSCAYLTRRLSPYLFTALRWTVSWLWWFVEGLVKVVAFLAVWAGVISTAIWLAAGAAMILAYAVLSARPAWRRFAADRPGRALLVKKVGGYGAGWWIVRKVLGRWVAKIVLVGLLGWEAWTFVRTFEADEKATFAPVPFASSTGPPSSSPASNATPLFQSSSPSDPAPPTPASPPEEASDEDLERWARQVKEEMLRDSLRRAGRTKSQVKEEDVAEGLGGEGGQEEDVVGPEEQE